MTIPNEVWTILTTLLGILGMYVAARATRIKNASQQQTFQAQGALLAAEGQLTTVKAEAEAKVAQAKADAEIKMSAAREDAEERGFMRAQLQAQLKVNEQFQNILVEKENRDESNYRVLANVQTDTNIALVNLINRTEDYHATQIAAIGSLPGAIQQSNADMLKDYARQLGAEIGAALAKQFAVQNLDRDMFPFPDPEDPAWTEKFIVPVTPSPAIHKQPYYNDAVKLRKPCAVINPEGEWLRVILGRLQDWVIVEKRSGDSHCWGWLPIHSVQIGDTPPINA